MRKTYTSVPAYDPATGQNKVWLPYLEVRVSRGNVVSQWLMAVVDSGSPYCLFRSDVAASIGLRDLTSGARGEIGSVKKGERDICYFHSVKLYVEGKWMIQVNAAFSENIAVPAILGRHGFFDHFLVTFDHAASPPSILIERFDKAQ